MTRARGQYSSRILELGTEDTDCCFTEPRPAYQETNLFDTRRSAESLQQSEKGNIPDSTPESVLHHLSCTATSHCQFRPTQDHQRGRHIDAHASRVPQPATSQRGEALGCSKRKDLGLQEQLSSKLSKVGGGLRMH